MKKYKVKLIKDYKDILSAGIIGVIDSVTNTIFGKIYLIYFGDDLYNKPRYLNQAFPLNRGYFKIIGTINSK